MGIPLNDPSQLAAYIASSHQEEISLAAAVGRGEPYYLIRLRKLILTSLSRFALVFFLISFFSFGLFLVPLIPMIGIICYKFHLFLSYLKCYNYAPRYFWFMLLIWNALCQIGCFYLRNWTFTLFSQSFH